MANIVLVLGGVRSGKSRFAQQLAQRLAGDDVLFVATAKAGDDEMARRIEVHRQTRPQAWNTLEVARGLGEVLRRQAPPQRVMLIDCITLLVSNVLLADGDPPAAELAQRRVAEEVEQLASACRMREGTVIVVSGEVGLGIVPESALGRLYRDLLGWANQALAAEADAAYLMVAGQAIELKRLASSVEQAAAKMTRTQ